MFNWLFSNKEKNTSVTHELAMRTTIEGKLKSYNADEDTTISQFSLANDEKERKSARKTVPVKGFDVWNQANPGETGKWKKDDRHK